MTFIFLVFWVLFCWLVYRYAKNKGHTAWIFLLVALVFSPLIGFLAALIIPARVTNSLSEDTKICPECAEHIKEAANVCRFCGHRFESTTVELTK